MFAALNSPVKTDPLAAIVFRRLGDTRRLMRKRPERMLMAMHVFELTKEEDVPRNIFPKGAGPVKGLRQAASLIGGRLDVDSDGFFIEFGDFQPPLHINKGPDAAWRTAATRAIQNAITRQLAGRVVSPDAPIDERRKRGARKDLHGIGEVVDVFATCSCLEGRATDVIKQHKDLWGKAGTASDLAKYRHEDIPRQRLQAVIVGSLRAHDRLHKAGLVKGSACKWCPCAEATLQHLVWDCPRWAEARAPFIKLINLYRDKLVGHAGGASRVQAFDRIRQSHCLRNCGVVPRADDFRKGGPKIPERSPNFGRLNAAIDELTPRQREQLQMDAEGRVVTYTDGSAIYPTEPRRRRASWAVRYAVEHPWNASGTVDTELQTAYRGELTAVVQTVRSAVMPTRIVADCEAVVNLMRDEIAGSTGKVHGDHADLWGDLREAVRNKAPGFLRWNGSAATSLLMPLPISRRRGGLSKGTSRETTALTLMQARP